MRGSWRRPAVALWLVVPLAVAAALAGSGTGGVDAAPLSVGVVEFYTPSPEAIINAVIPSRAATDEMTQMLAQAAGSGTITVLPRAVMQRAEDGLHWQNQDVLSFSRLGALAHAVGADRLVVGWLPIVGTAGGGNEPPPGKTGNGVTLITANVVVQIFDARQGRIVGETHSAGSAISGPVAALGTVAMLRNALAPTIPWLLSNLPETSAGTAGAVSVCCQ